MSSTDGRQKNKFATWRISPGKKRVDEPYYYISYAETINTPKHPKKGEIHEKKGGLALSYAETIDTPKHPKKPGIHGKKVGGPIVQEDKWPTWEWGPSLVVLCLLSA